MIHGDNSCVMRDLHAAGGLYTLVYMDPPFFTGEEFKMKSGEIAFSDRWTCLDDYVATMLVRVDAARALLTDAGSLVIHLDQKVSHYIKVRVDEIFGRENFASEIVWRYRRWPAKTRNFQRVHDVLLRWETGRAAATFNTLYEPLAPSTIATWGDRKQRAVAAGDGRRLRSSKTTEATPGVQLGDVWGIGIVAPIARERTGYPTQKPEALLKRLVEALTHPGDAVLDPYMGSGTTLSVCAQLGRSAVGIDSSPVAVRVARERLGIPYEVAS